MVSTPFFYGAVRQIRKILNILIPILCLAALWWVIDFKTLAQIFLSLSLTAVSNLMLISFLLILISAIKWKIFLQHLGAVVRLSSLYRWYLIGYFVNLILPSYLGGDAVRSFEIGKSVGQGTAAAATILERYTGFTAMLFLGCIAMNFSDLVTVQMKVALLGLGITVIAATLIALNRSVQTYVSGISFLSFCSKYFIKLSQSFRAVTDAPSVLIETYGLSLLYHSVTVLNVWACAQAVGWTNPSIKGLFVVLPLILTLGALPISPQGLGVQEGAFYFFLTHLGATSEQSLSIALLLRAKSYLLAILGGVLWIRGKYFSKLPVGE